MLHKLHQQKAVIQSPVPSCEVDYWDSFTLMWSCRATDPVKNDLLVGGSHFLLKCVCGINTKNILSSFLEEIGSNWVY